MLNITNNRIDKWVDLNKYKSSKVFEDNKGYETIKKTIWIFSILLLLILFLPWTQNVSGSGSVTTLKPNQRPQTIHTVIAGRIEKWYVQEGDFVKKGDTILEISEIKSEYFDPNLVERTGQQLKAKSSSVNSYSEKVKALNRQIAALYNERDLKIEQAKNNLMQAKLKNDPKWKKKKKSNFYQILFKR